ncbi:MAG: histidine kinase dimerization/phospho-acceptor domain-containing protein [Phycisphaerae bacterium]
MTSLRTRLLAGYLTLLCILVAAALINILNGNRTFELVLLGLAAAVAALFAGTTWRAATKPIEQMTKSALEVRSGRLDPAFSPAGPTEIAKLGESLRAMTDTLRSFRQYDEARLLRTQETTRLAINSLPHPIAVLSPDGHVDLANEPAERLFGLKQGEGLTHLPHKWLADLFNRACETMKTAQVQRFEEVVQVFDRSRERFFQPHAIPILDASNQLAGVTIVLVDATELRQVDEAKSSLISSASHELKTPLTSIQMAIHLLLEDAARFTPRQVELLQAARDDADRLHELIATLLDAGRREHIP